MCKPKENGNDTTAAGKVADFTKELGKNMKRIDKQKLKPDNSASEKKR